ncbi:MAG: universal stress protein [Spirochaetes bacterium]|nr:universal stress protein [Spirochaetota bacterium]
MKPEIGKILYATDLSKNSAQAFLYAMDLAEKYSAQIHILHIVEPMPSGVKPYLELQYPDFDFRNEVKKIAAELNSKLNSFCESVISGDPECTLKVESIDVHEGYPASEIIEKAKKIKCDLIVLGTHGKGIIKQTLLGSVAERVLHRTNIPLLVVPLPENEAEITEYDF